MKKLLFLCLLSSISILSANEEIKKCQSCHGEVFEKQALGTSKVVRYMKKEDIVKALNSYKNNKSKYGGSMRAIMSAQAANIKNVDSVAQKVVDISQGSTPKNRKLGVCLSALETVKQCVLNAHTRSDEKNCNKEIENLKQNIDNKCLFN